jgi:hypothetical protein
VLAYTAGGALVSAAIGVVLGSAGDAAGLGLTEPVVLWLVALLAGVAAARELGLVRYPLPEAHRASNSAWAKRWGPVRGAFMWGVDIGSFFTTWQTYAGGAWVVAVAFLSGSPAIAAGLMMAYWAGRAANAWLGPVMVPNAIITPALPTIWTSQRPRFARLDGLAVLFGAALIVAV